MPKGVERLCLTVASVLLGLAPALTAQTNTEVRPCLGAYIHIPELFSGESDTAKRQEAVERQLGLFKASGLRILLPYANTTSGAAEYPSEVIPRRAYGQWDPLAFLIAGAHKRGWKSAR